MNIGKFCPLPLCALIGNFGIYLYIVSLVVIFCRTGSATTGSTGSQFCPPSHFFVTLGPPEKSPLSHFFVTLVCSGFANPFPLTAFKNARNPIFVRNLFSSWKKGSLGRGRSGTSAQSFVLCFSVFWGDFLLQISQQFLSEIAPPMQAFSGKPPREKPQNAAANGGIGYTCTKSLGYSYLAWLHKMHVTRPSQYVKLVTTYHICNNSARFTKGGNKKGVPGMFSEPLHPGWQNLTSWTEKTNSKFTTLTLSDVIERYLTLLSFSCTLLGVIVTHVSVPQDVVAQ